MKDAGVFDAPDLRFPAEWKGGRLRVFIAARPEAAIEISTIGRSRAEAARRMDPLLDEIDAPALVATAYADAPNANGLIRTKRSRIAGTGVFARRDVSARTRVEDLTRPLVRYAQVPKEGEPGYGHAVQIDRGWWLLLDHSLCYFLNHRCGANTRLDIRGARVAVVASRRIRRGEELFLDYATVAFRDDPYAFNCTCGSPRCREVIRGERL
jgi:hypothetical protein